MSELASFILGLVIGLGTNLASWWITAHYIVPRIEFSPSISKGALQLSEIDRCGSRYRVKLRNGGRRGIIDVELAATIRIEGMSETKNIQLLPVPWDSEGEKRAHIVRLLPVKPGVKAARVLRLYVNAIDQLRTSHIYPEEIRKKAEEKTLTLEDILRLGTKAWLQIAAFGYDEFSGARKLFLSKSYTIDDIKEGPFAIAGLDVVAEQSNHAANEIDV